METVQTAAASLFAVNSIWSIVARGVIWFAVATTIIISTDTPHPERSLKKLKVKLGYLIMFLAVSGGLIFMLFSYMPG